MNEKAISLVAHTDSSKQTVPKPRKKRRIHFYQPNTPDEKPRKRHGAKEGIFHHHHHHHRGQRAPSSGRYGRNINQSAAEGVYCESATSTGALFNHCAREHSGSGRVDGECVSQTEGERESQTLTRWRAEGDGEPWKICENTQRSRDAEVPRSRSEVSRTDNVYIDNDVCNSGKVYSQNKDFSNSCKVRAQNRGYSNFGFQSKYVSNSRKTYSQSKHVSNSHKVRAQNEDTICSGKACARNKDTICSGKVCAQNEDTSKSCKVCNQSEDVFNSGKVHAQSKDVSTFGTMYTQNTDVINSGNVRAENKDVINSGNMRSRSKGVSNTGNAHAQNDVSNPYTVRAPNKDLNCSGNVDTQAPPASNTVAQRCPVQQNNTCNSSLHINSSDSEDTTPTAVSSTASLEKSSHGLPAVTGENTVRDEPDESPHHTKVGESSLAESPYRSTVAQTCQTVAEGVVCDDVSVRKGDKSGTCARSAFHQQLVSSSHFHPDDIEESICAQEKRFVVGQEDSAGPNCLQDNSADNTRLPEKDFKMSNSGQEDGHEVHRYRDSSYKPISQTVYKSDFQRSTFESVLEQDAHQSIRSPEDCNGPNQDVLGSHYGEENIQLSSLHPKGIIRAKQHSHGSELEQGAAYLSNRHRQNLHQDFYVPHTDVQVSRDDQADCNRSNLRCQDALQRQAERGDAQNRSNSHHQDTVDLTGEPSFRDDGDDRQSSRDHHADDSESSHDNDVVPHTSQKDDVTFHGSDDNNVDPHTSSNSDSHDDVKYHRASHDKHVERSSSYDDGVDAHTSLDDVTDHNFSPRYSAVGFMPPRQSHLRRKSSTVFHALKTIHPHGLKEARPETLLRLLKTFESYANVVQLEVKGPFSHSSCFCCSKTLCQAYAVLYSQVNEYAYRIVYQLVARAILHRHHAHDKDATARRQKKKIKQGVIHFLAVRASMLEDHGRPQNARAVSRLQKEFEDAEKKNDYAGASYSFESLDSEDLSSNNPSSLRETKASTSSYDRRSSSQKESGERRNFVSRLQKELNDAEKKNDYAGASYSFESLDSEDLSSNKPSTLREAKTSTSQYDRRASSQEESGERRYSAFLFGRNHSLQGVHLQWKHAPYPFTKTVMPPVVLSWDQGSLSESADSKDGGPQAEEDRSCLTGRCR